MPQAISLLDNLAIASPCQASWQGMTGDDQVRFCAAEMLACLLGNHWSVVFHLSVEKNARRCRRGFRLHVPGIPPLPRPSSSILDLVYRHGGHAWWDKGSRP